MPTVDQTQLNITTAIAIAGLLVALLGVFLTVRRDRAAGKVGAHAVVSTGREVYFGDKAPELRVKLSNPERRPVTVQRAGFAMRRWRARRVEFEGWDHGGKTACPPVTFEPGDPAFTITARLFRVRAVVWPDVPKWVWGEDPSGRVLFWERIPESDRALIAQVRPQRVIRDDGFRHGYEPIPEGEPIEGQELEVWQD